MSKSFISILIIVAFSSFKCYSQEFEGVVKYSMKYKSSELDAQTSSMLPTGSIMNIKGNKLNMRILGGMAGMMGMETLIMEDKNEMYNIIPSQRMAIKVKMESINNTENKEEIVKTKETKSISGYNCTKYVIKTNDGDMIAWITNELKVKIPGNKMNTKNGMGNMFVNAIDEGFLVSSTLVSEKLTIETTLEGIEKKKLDDSLFTVPKDYMIQEFSLEQLQMMMGGQ